MIPLALSAQVQGPQAGSANGVAATTGNADPLTHPSLTADEIGRRYLKLLEDVKSRSDLTSKHVQAVMGLTLKDGRDAKFHTQSLGDGWVYSVSLHPEKRPGNSIALELEFIEKADRFADMSSICGLTFEDYHNALKAMGYRDIFQYDQIDGQVGRLISVEYRKGDFFVSIIPEVMRFSDGKVYPTCVRRIGLLADGPDARPQSSARREATPARFGEVPAFSVDQQAAMRSSTAYEHHMRCEGRSPFLPVNEACLRAKLVRQSFETQHAALTEMPAIGAGEVGQRFLKLIERFNAGESLSVGTMAEAMGVPVAQMEPRHYGYSAAIAIDDHWSYALELWQDASSEPWAAITLQFDHADDHEYADFSPACEMSLAAYRETFKASGYSETLDRDQQGRLLSVGYATGRMFIQLTPGMIWSDQASSPSCVRRIELMNRAKSG